MNGGVILEIWRFFSRHGRIFPVFFDQQGA